MTSSEGGEPNRNRVAYAAWIAVCFFWGTGYLATRVGVSEMPPMLFAGLRILGAGLLVTVWRLLRGDRPPSSTDLGPLAVVGLATEGFCNGGLAWSAQWIPSGMLALLIAMTSFWMVGIEALLPNGDRLTAPVMGGLLLGFGGLAMLVAPQLHGLDLGSHFLAGCVVMQLVCLFYGAGSVYARWKPVTVKPLMAAGVQMLVAGGALTLLGTALGEWPAFHFQTRSLAAFVYLLLFPSAVGFGAYIYSLQHLPISLVSLHRYINPVVAVLLGWLILGERFTARDLLGVLLIAGGVLAVRAARPPTNQAAGG